MRRALAAAAASMVWFALPLPASGSDAGPALAAPASHDAEARAAVAALPRATAVNDADGNKLFDDLDAAYRSADAPARLPVIVSFVRRTPTMDGVARVRSVAPSATVRRAFSIIPAFAGALTAGEAARVAALDEVRQIELDRAGELELETATQVMGADAVVDEIGVDGSLDDQPRVATAEDVGIAVLDTGLHASHQELAGKVIGWRDFGTGRAAPYDPDGHGTHVASIAAGWGAQLAHRGVAPGASVIGIKIDGGGTTASNAIAGYQWLVDRKDQFNVRVATISFGFGTATDGTTALERSIDAAWDAGIVCFKSNGNSGPRKGSMTVPAAARGILAIGSLLDPHGAPDATSHGFTLSHYSSRGPTSDGRIKPDLVAPGQSITAARAGTTGGYVAFSGTSMASPFAAGTAALMIAADPTLTPDDVRSVLYATAQDWGWTGPDVDYGHGRIQVWHAVEEVLRRQGQGVGDSTPPAVPAHEAFTAWPTAGVHEATFTVRDTNFPVAVTAIADVAVGAVAVFDPAGNLVGSATAVANPADRQHQITFAPTVLGRYTVRVVATAASPLAVDVSHSTASGASGG